MSRRRPKLGPPSLPEMIAGPRRYTTKVVCSDRGQHPQGVLYHLRDERDVRVFTERAVWPEGQKNGVPITVWNPETGNQSFRFRCPRCRRDVQLRQDTLLRIIDALAERADSASEHPVIDISLLPC